MRKLNISQGWSPAVGRWALRRSWPEACLFFSFLFLVFLNSSSFSLLYYGEDFVWIPWGIRPNFMAVMEPAKGQFYRPLVANIPFSVFTSFSQGRIWWKFLTFLAMGAATFSFWCWIRNTIGSAWLALFFTVLWIFNPSQYLGLYYIVGWGYILAPLLLTSILACLKREKFMAALLLSAVGLGVKEYFLAIPALLLLFRWGYSVPWKYVFGSILAPISFLLVHRGFSFGERTAGGFNAVSNFDGFWQHFKTIGASIFLGNSGFPEIDLWYRAAWLAVSAALMAALLETRSSRLWRGPLVYLAALLLFFLPVAILQGVKSTDLAPFYWIFLFGAAGEAIAITRWRRFGNALLALILTAPILYYSYHAPALRIRSETLADKYLGVITSAAPLLAGCGQFDDIVISGLDEVFPFNLYADFAQLDLSWFKSDARFYILSESSLNEELSERRVQPSQSVGHPRLHFSEEPGGRIIAEWQKGSPSCRTSVEAKPKVNGRPNFNAYQ